jgi:septal ring factor EnvC (AmiA/AmiB activator)
VTAAPLTPSRWFLIVEAWQTTALSERRDAEAHPRRVPTEPVIEVVRASELDAARERIAELEHANDLADEVDIESQLRAQIEDVRLVATWAARDRDEARSDFAELEAKWTDRNDNLLRERDEARAQVERMRPVVEAALAWGDSPTMESSSEAQLEAAVDAYRAGEQPDPYKGVDPRGGKRYGEGV